MKFDDAVWTGPAYPGPHACRTVQPCHDLHTVVENFNFLIP